MASMKSTTLKELREMAGKLGLTNYEKMKKAELYPLVKTASNAYWEDYFKRENEKRKRGEKTEFIFVNLITGERELVMM